ncbi:phospholipase B1, membrane-associated [Teleopsis dalmanni]|uniref:phospholipase B1, membrane-associated n=1 Tax=Teleopsis dalmanni TaxID=139649 RepID=UPI0018CEEA71|nr:phospholipase B1, membrane-associated [Teleopsis dalmanni]
MLSKVYLLLLLLSLGMKYSAAGLFDLRAGEDNFAPSNSFSLRRVISDVSDAFSGKRLVTELDGLRGLFVMLRHMTMNQAFNNMDNLYDINDKQGKLQRRMSRAEKFPCDLSSNARSFTTPTSINRLRPGDIDIVASLGDSLSAGNGEISDNIVHILNEFRGISFTGGGHGDWRSFLTLPNILKVFNPNLYGYSTENGLTVDSVSRLNIAEPMVMSRDLPFQARVLIDRMRHDPHVDMVNHWKLLTIFVGNNDICSDMCHYEHISTFLKHHEMDLRSCLTILRDNVPRLLVNLVPAPNMATSLHKMSNVPLVCSAMHTIGCHCIFSDLITAVELEVAAHNVNSWHAVEEYVASLPEFNTENFAVVFQPFTANITMPTMRTGDVDLRFFASDCFHFSQKGHAAAANSLWNNMLEPVGQKKAGSFSIFERFECPTAERPYIATLQNS